MIGIYHSKDLDGYCSGAILKLKYPDIKLIGMDYGEKPFENPNNEKVIICDMSFPMNIMVQIAKDSGWNLTWIDHHKSAIKDYKEFIGSGETFCNAVLEDGISACEGTWKYLFPDRPIPEVVKLLGEYDTWRNQDKEHWDNVVMPFQYYMRLRCSSPDTFPMYLFDDDDNGKRNIINQNIEVGKYILDYQKQQNEKACKFCAFEMEFEGLRAICLNSGGANSQLFASVYDESKHDIMIPFVFTGKHWTYSIYSTKPEIDCSVLAKKYGGGGHKGASGFKIDYNIFDKDNV
jgi:uncharacterized protein